MANKTPESSRNNFELILPEVRSLSKHDLETTGLLSPLSRFMKTLQPLKNPSEDSTSSRNGILLYGGLGCGEEMLIVPVLLHFQNIKVRMLNLMTLANSKLKDHELILHIRKLFTTVRVKQAPTIIHIMHAEQLWDEPVSFRMEKILVGLKCQLELLANSRSKVFYFTHVTDPWNIPKDLLVYFPTRIRLPPLPSPEARLIAFKYFINDDQGAFSCNFPLSDEEFLEICRHPQARCLYWNDIKAIIRSSLAKACLALLDIEKLSEISLNLTRRQRKKLQNTVVKTEFIFQAIEAHSPDKERRAELNKLTEFMRDHSNIEEIPIGKNHLRFTVVEEDTTLDSSIYSELNEFLSEVEEEEDDDDEFDCSMCFNCTKKEMREYFKEKSGTSHQSEVLGLEIVSEEESRNVMSREESSITADATRALSEHVDNHESYSYQGISENMMKLKINNTAEESLQLRVGQGDLRIAMFEEPLIVNSDTSEIAFNFNAAELFDTLSLISLQEKKFHFDFHNVQDYGNLNKGSEQSANKQLAKSPKASLNQQPCDSGIREIKSLKYPENPRSTASVKRRKKLAASTQETRKTSASQSAKAKSSKDQIDSFSDSQVIDTPAGAFRIVGLVVESLPASNPTQE